MWFSHILLILLPILATSVSKIDTEMKEFEQQTHPGSRCQLLGTVFQQKEPEFGEEVV